VKDPYEWNNLAGDPRYAEVKKDLRRRLLEWMRANGDKGQQTELEADMHLARNRNKKMPDSGGSKNKKKQRKTKRTG